MTELLNEYGGIAQLGARFIKNAPTEKTAKQI